MRDAAENGYITAMPAEKSLQWLRNAAGVQGFIGFAVGRTSFWGYLAALRDSKVAREQIARRYMEWISIFEIGQANPEPSQ